MFSKIRTVFKYQNRRRQIFTILYPSVGNFLPLSIGKFGKFFSPPPPLQNANVLNEWSLKQNYLTINEKGVVQKTPIDLLRCSSVQWVYEAKS